MTTLLHVALSSGIAIAGLALSATAISAADQAPGDKVYELRIYKCNPGKLPALHARFRDHTCRLFQKHGIELVGFWTPTQRGGQAFPGYVSVFRKPVFDRGEGEDRSVDIEAQDNGRLKECGKGRAQESGVQAFRHIYDKHDPNCQYILMHLKKQAQSFLPEFLVMFYYVAYRDPYPRSE